MVTKPNALPPRHTAVEDTEVRTRVQRAQEKMKIYTDGRRPSRPARITVGDWVRARRVGGWHGPLQVLKQRGKVDVPAHAV